MRGRVTRIIEDKQYGWIRESAGSPLRFFHGVDVLDGAFDAMLVGQIVGFEPVVTDRGPRAVKVRIVTGRP